MPSKTPDELILLVQQIMDARLPEREHDALLEELKQSVLHPRISDLIYYSDPELTAEEVVDQALAYRPIAL
ncbi:bacteriocin immunity protein [Streptomyces sp. NPDC007851]|uniref:bacteriocin immunity protein n=1 Tax=Streptomyces sp. NPDC007851 TaxID=3155008 RepID=UPI00340D0A4B